MPEDAAEATRSVELVNEGRPNRRADAEPRSLRLTRPSSPRSHPCLVWQPPPVTATPRATAEGTSLLCMHRELPSWHEPLSTRASRVADDACFSGATAAAACASGAVVPLTPRVTATDK